MSESVDDLVEELHRMSRQSAAMGMMAAANCCLQAVELLTIARTVTITPEGGDLELLKQLAHASRACDSSLMEMAYWCINRLRHKIHEMETLRCP